MTRFSALIRCAQLAAILPLLQLALNTATAADDGSASVASTITLDVKDAALSTVLEQIEQQTGNRLVDFREKFGQESSPKRVTLELKDQLFWKAIDKLLDAAQMSPYPFSGEAELALVEREAGSLRRFDRAAYAGAFRIEATGVSADRGLRNPAASGLRLELQIEWEPRLAPIAIIQSAEDLSVECDDGLELLTVGDDEAFSVDVTPGCHAVDATVMLQLPSRKATSIASFKGTLHAQVPGKIAEMKFERLAQAENIENELGGVTVTLVRTVKADAVWEIHLTVEAPEGEEGGDHRGWMYQNECYLLDPQGKRVDHAGYETSQTDEAGFTYLFEIDDSIDGYTFIYRTPTDIVAEKIEYELTNLPLP